MPQNYNMENNEQFFGKQCVFLLKALNNSLFKKRKVFIYFIDIFIEIAIMIQDAFDYSIFFL